MDEERERPVDAPNEALLDEEDALGAEPEDAPIEEIQDEPEAMARQAGPPEGEAELPDAKHCPNLQCQYDKHEPDAHFCILCGTLLFTHCEDCLVNNAPYARFCRLCGADLDELRAESSATE